MRQILDPIYRIYQFVPVWTGGVVVAAVRLVGQLGSGHRVRARVVPAALAQVVVQRQAVAPEREQDRHHRSDDQITRTVDQATPNFEHYDGAP